jgi:FAD:protein FMN transferase
MNISEYSAGTQLMGTQINIKISENISKIDANNLLNEALNIFYKVVARLTRFENSSDLSILNKHAGEWFETGEELINLIEVGLRFTKLTNGLFNIGIGQILEEYGYKSIVNIVDLQDSNIRKLQSIQYLAEQIELDSLNHKVYIPKGISIDLGSFAKGYAIKLAKEYLEANKIQNFIINAGGDIYAGGRKSKTDMWKATLFDPDNPEKSKILEIENLAVTSSGRYGRKYKNFHHLINPQSAKPFDAKTVFVSGRDPMIADLVSTIAYFQPNNLKEILKSTDTELICI